VKRLILLLLPVVAAKADILYTWTLTNNTYHESVSYAFSVPDFPTSSVIGSDNLKISGYAGSPNYSCEQWSAEDCIAEIKFTSAPNTFTDLNTNFGQAAMVVCWDAGAFGCDTGSAIMEGAFFPGLDIHQFGTYDGTVVGGSGNMSTELVIVDPPSSAPASSAPEPGSAWLVLLAAVGFCGLYRIRLKNRAQKCRAVFFRN
jgi:hypothetical protein